MKLIHATKAKFTIFFEPEQSNMNNKPMGLWYAPEDIWVKFTKNNNMNKIFKYFYQVKLDYTTFSHPDSNKVLQIKNERDFLDVTFKYGYLETIHILGNVLIDWRKFAKDFGGIEIIPFPKKLESITDPALIKEFKDHGWDIGKKSLKMTWLYYVDISSGCVWNKKGLKSIKEVSKGKIMELWKKEKETHVRFIMDRNKKMS